MSERLTILDVASRIAARPGFEPPSARWSATLAYLYGLPISDADAYELVAATGRSRGAIIEHARATLGRRRFRQLWARIGRRGRKSATAALIAVYEAIWGGHERYVLPGEQALCAVISKDLAGASVVARFARLYLDALGIRYGTTRIGAVALIEIEGSQIAIATLACASDAPRGFAICCLVLDEVAHFQTGDEYTDSDTSILTGAEPAMAQFPDALVVGISTGLGRDGVHYERVERGLGNDDEHEILAVGGASWDWASGITPERAAEIAGGDADTLATEFQGLVSENESTAFVLEHVGQIYGEHPGHYVWGKPFIVLDPAEMVNTMSGCVARWGEPTAHRAPQMMMRDGFAVCPLRDNYGRVLLAAAAERPILLIDHVFGWTGEELQQTPMDQVMRDIAHTAKQAGADTVFSDRRADVYIAALLSHHSIKVRSFTQTMRSKHEAVTLIRAWMRDRQVAICDHAQMKRDLETYPRRIAGGFYRYGERRSGQKHHWDYASLLVTLAHSALADDRNTPEETSFHIESAPTRRAIGGRSITGSR